MEITETIYSGESSVEVSFVLGMAPTEIAESDTLLFLIGPEGGDNLASVTATAVPDDDATATTVTITVTFDPVPDLPDGVYPWQLVVSGGELLASGTIPIGALIDSAPTVTITVGTDTYISVDDADELLAMRLGMDAWRAASADDRTRALYTATSAIDKLMLTGMPKTTDQALAFPRVFPIRGGSAYYQPAYSSPWNPTEWVVQDDVPASVLLATALEAAALLSGHDSERARLQMQGVKSISVGGASETYTGVRVRLCSPEAADLMREFIAGSVAIR